MSPYLNRELAVDGRDELEAHILVCASCQTELEVYRKMVLGMQALPLPRPSQDFSARLMARWRERKDDPELAASAAACTGFPASTSPVEAAPAPVQPARSHWGPPPTTTERRASQVRSFYATAAMIAVVFFAGLVFGKAWTPAPAGARVHPKDFVTAMLPVDMDFQGRQGKSKTWNQGKLVMQPEGQVDDSALRDAEIAVHVPAGVKLQFLRTATPSVTFAPSLEPSAVPSEIMSLPCSVGSWQRDVTWMADRDGSFQAWIEVRSRETEGIYRREAVMLIASP